MEVDGASDHMIMVAIYELLGTSMLCYAVLVSTGNPEAVAFTVFTLILILGPVTGAHMNPAVTIGVYVTKMKYINDLFFMITIIIAQCIGGFLAIGMAVASLYKQDLIDDKLIIPSWIPFLCPLSADPEFEGQCDKGSGGRHLQTFLS